MSPRARRLVTPLVLAGVGLTAIAYVGVVDPNDPGHYPLCPTKALTGLDCPGCGGLRAVHSLAHLDVVGALDHNAFVVALVLPVVVALWVAWLAREWRGPQVPDTPAAAPRDPLLQRPVPVWTFLAVMVVFTVVRNVSASPTLSWLGSAPG